MADVSKIKLGGEVKNIKDTDARTRIATLEQQIDSITGAEVMTGATSTTNGTAGLVPAPTTEDRAKFLRGNGEWTTVSQGDLTVQYNVTLLASGWSNNTYTATISNLTCGEGGDISPIVMCTSNQEEYNNITNAVADPDNNTIVFTISEAPTNDIGIIVQDKVLTVSTLPDVAQEEF